MITRDVLNYGGQKIGELSFPDGTAEEIIAAKLAIYSRPATALIPDITPRQVRLALLEQGLTVADVTAAIEAALTGDDKEKALIEWEYSIAYNRYHPFVDSIGLLLGFSSTQLDSLWLAASEK